MLTTKQKELLVFINGRLQETGVPPSFDEMKEALNLQSKSGVHRLIIALEAANPNYETRIFGPDQVDIQGRLVGLIRRF